MSSATMDVFKGTLSVLFLMYALLGFVNAAHPWKDYRGPETSEEARLIHDLITRSTRLARPVKHVNETLRVNFGLALIILEGIDEVAQTMDTNMWIRQSWTDFYLKWDPGNYSGIDHVRIPVSKIWQPDLVLYNSRGKMDMMEALAIVSSDGHVLYIPPARMKSHCTLDMRYFPMDTQTCYIKIGSWTYDGFKMDVDFYDGLEQVDLSDYVAGHEWQLLEAPAKKNVKYYPCCEEPYPDLTFSVKLQRRNEYYKFVYIGPAILLAILAPFIFLLPPADSQKVMLGIGLLICFTVFFNSVGNVLPSIHEHTPLIDKYYMTQYVLIVVSIMLSTLVANIARRTIRLSRPPAIVTKVVLSGFGRCLCVSQNMYSNLPSSEGAKSDLVERGSEPSLENTQNREWLLIATVIDRLFFVLSVIVTILMTVIILNSYPRN